MKLIKVYVEENDLNFGLLVFIILGDLSNWIVLAKARTLIKSVFGLLLCFLTNLPKDLDQSILG